MNFRKIISYFLLFSFIIVLLNDCRTLQNLFRKPKVCLVLSVGGDKGISHIGGIDALKERNIQIDCIFGNSMGSVIGSLYATAPNENLRERYGKFIAEYIKKTEKEIKGGFLTGFLIGLGAMLVTGGTLGWETMLGSLGAGAITSSFHEKFDNDRFKRVMNEYYKNITVDKTIIPFATEYQYLKGQGLEMHIATTENLAEAVSRSANNPFIFKGAKLTYIDPGGDRAASVPIEETCLHYNPTKIIALNVTGAKAYYSEKMNCDVEEIMINLKESSPEAIKGTGKEFEKNYKIGYETVKKHIK